MRYYDIAIRNKKGQIISPNSQSGLTNVSVGNKSVSTSTYTSYVGGQTLGGALDVQLQFQITGYANPTGGTTSNFVRIFGVSLQEISQASNLNGLPIVVKAGMQKGLPLANPHQNGVILNGTIYQAYGNWEGNIKSLDIQVQGISNSDKKNFTFNWPKNTPLADAIKSTLAAALPNNPPVVKISSRLVMSSDMTGTYDKLEDFSTAIKTITSMRQFQGIKTVSGAPYKGVDINKKDDTIVVVDGTDLSYTKNTSSNPKIIDILDMVGQPTWIGPQQVQVKTVMRADININDYIKMPSALRSPFVLTAPNAAIPGGRNDLAFQGVFNVTGIDQWGRFRAPDASAWVTTFTLTQAGDPNSNTGDASSTITGGIV